MSRSPLALASRCSVSGNGLFGSIRRQRKRLVRLDPPGAEVEIDDLESIARLLVEPQQLDVLEIESAEGTLDLEIRLLPGLALRLGCLRLVVCGRGRLQQVVPVGYARLVGDQVDLEIAHHQLVDLGRECNQRSHVDADAHRLDLDHRLRAEPLGVGQAHGAEFHAERRVNRQIDVAVKLQLAAGLFAHQVGQILLVGVSVEDRDKNCHGSDQEDNCRA
jgi:hypothetical protein